MTMNGAATMLNRAAFYRSVCSTSGHSRQFVVAQCQYWPEECSAAFVRSARFSTGTEKILRRPSSSSPLAGCSMREFSSRSQSTNGTRNLLMNEHLIKVLMRTSSASSAESLQVRMVVDKGRDTQSTVEIVSVLQAVRTSQDLGLDLVAINLEQDPPIIKALDYSKSEFNSKRKSKQMNANNNRNAKATKEFKFRSGIAENDLQRKARDLLHYLEKGHPCQITVMSKKREVLADPMSSRKMVERIQKRIGDAGVSEKAGIQGNTTGTYASLILQPNKTPS